MSRSKRPPCPHPEKTVYRNRIDAELEVIKIWRRLRGGPRMRAYKCECWRWHLTTARKFQ